ncbi:hypothetical protein [Haloarcula montana]|uniref:hypothetical protein n=1 Tax=Haloarcula montana TaxID=3111776 RepID=UPI002D76E3BE|nr:hypothetical protein [Haloarcula sp. GH36]
MVPLLFPGIPGGIELLVVLLMMAFLVVVPGVLLLAVYLVGKRRGRSEASEAGDPEP